MKHIIHGLTTILLFLSYSTGFARSAPIVETPSHTHRLASYGKLPLSFEANQGQTDKSVKFLSRGTGYTLYLTPGEALFSLRQKLGHSEKHPEHILRMTLAGANSQARAIGLEPLPGKINYLKGNDPKQWRTNIPTYSKVKYDQIYPGIDLVYYGNQRQLEYDFIVAPGADPEKIRLDFSKSTPAACLTPRLNSSGDLVLGEVRLQKPIIYQEIGGKRRDIAGRFVVHPNGQMAFQVAAYDKSKPLVIDPVLIYSTYLGGNDWDEVDAIAVGTGDNAYVAGYTASGDFPVTSGVFQSTPGGFEDAFIAKLSSDGSKLLYATFLGGNQLDKATGIAVDALGNVFVTGNTVSADFPITNNAYQSKVNQGRLSGAPDAFVARLTPNGDNLAYSTYFGGRFTDEVHGIAIGAEGDAYITGSTNSLDFPVVNAYQTAINPGDGTTMSSDAFVAKFDNVGNPVYSTYFGGKDHDVANGIAVDKLTDEALITGWTSSTNFPVTLGAYQTAFNVNATRTKMRIKNIK